jgi:formate transporter
VANEINIDAPLPPDMAVKAANIGVKKAQLDLPSMFALAVLAGAFIAMGAVFATTLSAGNLSVKSVEGSMAVTTALPYGITRLLAGMAFSLGLIMVVVAGAELFTGNNLIIMAWASRLVTTRALLRNWVVVYVGNFVGAIVTAGLMFLTRQYTFGDGAIGLTALNTANAKTGLDLIQAIALGIFCNALVCLAVWLCYSARSTTDKILAIVPPITAFVAAGFEHSIANMYFIPIGLFIKDFASADFWIAIGTTPGKYANLTWQNFFIANLLPVTIGNVIGGAIMVGTIYWFIYSRGQALIGSYGSNTTQVD